MLELKKCGREWHVKVLDNGSCQKWLRFKTKREALAYISK